MIKGGFWIRVTCDRCGNVQEFTKQTKAEAIRAARVAGWAMNREPNSGGELCKNCYTPILTIADLRVARLAKRAHKGEDGQR